MNTSNHPSSPQEGVQVGAAQSLENVEIDAGPVVQTFEALSVVQGTPAIAQSKWGRRNEDARILSPENLFGPAEPTPVTSSVPQSTPQPEDFSSPALPTSSYESNSLNPSDLAGPSAQDSLDETSEGPVSRSASDARPDDFLLEKTEPAQSTDLGLDLLEEISQTDVVSNADALEEDAAKDDDVRPSIQENTDTALGELIAIESDIDGSTEALIMPPSDGVEQDLRQEEPINPDPLPFPDTGSTSDTLDQALDAILLDQTLEEVEASKPGELSDISDITDTPSEEKVKEESVDSTQENHSEGEGDETFQLKVLLERPETLLLMVFVIALLAWQVYDELLKEVAPEGALQSRELASRLGVKNRELLRRRRQADLGTWTQSLDPDGIAWSYAKGVFSPQD